MKKLLITTDSFPPRYDGISRFLSEIIPRLSKYYKITVIAPGYGNINYKNVKIVKIPISKINIAGYKPPKIYLKLIKYLVSKNDIIFNHTIGPIGLISILFASKQNKPIISYIHSIEWELFSEAVYLPGIIKKQIKFTTKKLAKILYNKCTKLLVASKDIKDIIESIGITKKIEIVPVGIGDEFKPGDTKEKFGLKNKFVIGYVGRLSREKNLETLLESFKKLKNKDITLLLVGDGPYKNKLKFKNVKITGFVKNVNDYLNTMDVFVMPSLTETSSIATLEAMKSGLPIISTNVGYMKNYIKNGKNGFIFKIRDIGALTKLINKLRNNEKLRKKLGKEARKSVSKLNWEKTAFKIYKIIRNL